MMLKGFLSGTLWSRLLYQAARAATVVIPFALLPWPVWLRILCLVTVYVIGIFTHFWDRALLLIFYILAMIRAVSLPQDFLPIAFYVTFGIWLFSFIFDIVMVSLYTSRR